MMKHVTFEQAVNPTQYNWENKSENNGSSLKVVNFIKYNLVILLYFIIGVVIINLLEEFLCI
jgi:ABC-type lipoprotein release transport system permease subunit